MRYRFNWPPLFAPIIREVLVPNRVDIRAFQPFVMLLTGILLALYAMKGLYRLPRTAGLFDHAGIIISSTTTGVALLVVLIFIFSPFSFYSRLIYAFTWIVVIVMLCASRAWLIEVQRWRWMRGIGRERVLVVGGTGLARGVMGGIVAQPFLGYALVGYLDDRPPPPTERRDGHFRYLGPIDELPTLNRLLKVDQVILALPFWEHWRLPELVAACRATGVDFRVAPDLHELSYDRVDVGNIGGVPLIGLKRVSLKGWNLVVKRVMDLTLTLLASPLLLMIVAIIALAVKYDSPGPAIFKQQRVGRRGRVFTVYKFRTMVIDAEARKADLAAFNEADGPIFKMRNDPRITRVGRFLRKTSLDELPNLWNVVRGEMSLVGPRPPTPHEVDQYEEWHRRRLEVTPGMTGLWQVLGRSDTSFDEMVRLDIYYAENWTPALDLRILLQTLPVVTSGKGAY
jgi:exopolysaccharide biosynthesis polyprenyl glycosylphosphotransferase